MNALTLIYMAAALAIGFMFGIIVELMFDTQTIRELQTKNRKLTLENVQLRREELRREEKHEVIEILDKTVDPENIPDYKGGF